MWRPYICSKAESSTFFEIFGAAALVMGLHRQSTELYLGIQNLVKMGLYRPCNEFYVVFLSLMV